MSRARGWCFTVNNPDKFLTPEWYKRIECTYLVVGEEKGAKGTPHHQGYVHFKTQKTFNGVKRILPMGAHIEQARGTPRQAADYCLKEKMYCEFGECPCSGRRTDIEEVKDILRNGGGMNAVVNSTNSYQAWRAGEMFLKYQEPRRDWKPVVKWYWGATGTGKTRTAMEELPDAWVSASNLRWWDGYDGHADVILDDFRGDFCPFHVLLRILDRYAYRVETKGGSRQLLAKRIIITCPYPPENLYTTIEDKTQLLRRLDSVINFKSPCVSEVGGNTSPDQPKKS